MKLLEQLIHKVKRRDGAPERIRTSNRLIRSQVLYPVELRVHIKITFRRFSHLRSNMRDPETSSG